MEIVLLLWALIATYFALRNGSKHSNNERSIYDKAVVNSRSLPRISDE